MVIFSVCANNYLHLAAHMAASARTHHPDAVIVLCLVENVLHSACRDRRFFDHTLLVGNIGIPNFKAFSFRHGVIELATAVKPRMFLHLMDVFPDENAFVYLDPDTEVHGALNEAQAALDDSEVILTPHHLEDVDDPQAIVDVVLPVLKCGIYNLGFVAVRRGNVSRAFLKWWEQKLAHFCFVDYNQGLFVDQKWVDLATSLFALSTFREPGYNVARWNIGARTITRSESGYQVNGRPLKLIHFSQIETGRDQYYWRRYAGVGEPIHELRRAYKRAVAQTRAQVDDNAGGWTFDYFRSGERIAWESRLAVRNRPQLFADCGDPYAESNEYFLSR